MRENTRKQEISHQGAAESGAVAMTFAFNRSGHGQPRRGLAVASGRCSQRDHRISRVRSFKGAKNAIESRRLIFP